jgi:nucleotide-binding universal stress UspA family protein
LNAAAHGWQPPGVGVASAVTMRLLIAYDGSPAARSAVATAGTLFAPAEAVLLTVREPQLHEVDGAMARVRLPAEVVRAGLDEIEQRVAERARRTVDQGLELAAGAGLEARGVVVASAHPWRAIVAAATEHEADLVVCGTNGHAPIGRAFLGSTSSSLLHHAATPVLVIPAAFRPVAGPVLIGYDGSPAADCALRFAAEHFRDRRAVVACVWRSPVRRSMDAQLLRCLPAVTVHEFVTDYDAAYAEAAQRTAQEGSDTASALGMPAEAHPIESGATPWRPLLELARAEHATIIVAGAARDNLLGAAIGSVSSGLVHHAATGILIVPEPPPADEAPAPSSRRAVASAS